MDLQHEEAQNVSHGNNHNSVPKKRLQTFSSPIMTSEECSLPKRLKPSTTRVLSPKPINLVSIPTVEAPIICSKDLANLLVSGCDLSKPIILDIRGLHSQFNMRIPGAIGMPCESRVKLRLALPMLDELLQENAKDNQTQYGARSDEQLIVLCTDFHVTLTPRSNPILRKLVSHIQQKHRLPVRVIEGGFQEFYKLFPDLCERPRSLRSCTTDSRLPSSDCKLKQQVPNSSEKNSSPVKRATNDVLKSVLYSSHELLILPGLCLHTVCSERHRSFDLKVAPEMDWNVIDTVGNSIHCPELCGKYNSTEVYLTKISQVLPFLFIGNEFDGANEETLRSCNISCILNVTPKVPFLDETRFRCRRLALLDAEMENLQPLFQSAFEFIEQSRVTGRNLLVHCQAGVSRSPAFVIAYVMTHSSLSLHEAYHYVKTRRPIISPNFAFLGQLCELESNLSNGLVARKPETLDCIIASESWLTQTDAMDDSIAVAISSMNRTGVNDIETPILGHA